MTFMKKEEKDIVLVYRAITHHYVLNPLRDPETLKPTFITDEEAREHTDHYFKLMKKYGLPVYE